MKCYGVMSIRLKVLCIFLMCHTHFLQIAVNSESVIPQPSHGKPPQQIHAQPWNVFSSQRAMQLGKARQLYLYRTFHTQGRLKVLHM